MKKIFTSFICLAAALVASAQNFTVTGIDGVTYNDGDVVNIGYTAGQLPGKHNWDPELKVNVLEATSSLTKRSVFTVTAYADAANIVQFCGLDGNCLMLAGSPVTKSGSYAADQSFFLQIDILNKVIANPITASVSITDGEETINLTINFLTTEQASIDAPEVAAPALTLNGHTLTYNVDSPTNLTLYNISGRAVMNRNVNNSGTISLDGFHAGVYVYRLGTLTGKILVR